ncbi:MAG: hypothetical protein AAFP86_14680, partial [Planctomycetota bacterium]
GGGGSEGRIEIVRVYRAGREWVRYYTSDQQLNPGDANPNWSLWREVATPATQAFQRNFVTTDWAGPNADGDYTLTIPATQHLVGRTVTAPTVFKLTGDDLVPDSDTRKTVSESTGDVVLTVTAFPDERFDGRAIVRGY